MSRVILGVTGGIAAYKACELLRRLQGAGHDVTVVPTAAALEFVGAATWAALSGRPVHTSVFDDAHLVPHVKLGQEADLVVVAPATADLLARAADRPGRRPADQRAAHRPRPGGLRPGHAHRDVAAPRHPGQRRDCCASAAPWSSTRTPAGSPARTPDRDGCPSPAELFAVAGSMLADPTIARRAAEPGPGRADRGRQRRRHPGAPGPGPLPRQRLLRPDGLGAGPGRRPARRRRPRWSRPHVVEPPPPNVEVERVISTADLAAAMEVAAKGADVVVMAAAPADFTPAETSQTKIKKSGDAGLALDLVQTHRRAGRPGRRPHRPAAGAGRVRRRDPGRTGSLLELGRAKLARKGCDLLVLNEVGPGLVFGQPDSEITVLGGPEPVGPLAGSKDMLAHRIWDEALAARSRR